MSDKCDCTAYCGDDPYIRKEKATPCEDYKRREASNARIQALSSIDALLAQHGALLQDNEHCYFELAYTRSTGWMAFICDKPLGGTVGTPEFGVGRKIITSGQGKTPDDACANALLALGAKA